MSDDPMLGVQRTLGEIVGELRGIREDFSHHFQSDKEQFEGIRKEINAINKKTWFGSGFAAAFGSLFTLWMKGH